MQKFKHISQLQKQKISKKKSPLALKCGFFSFSTHLLQHLADILAPKDEEDDDDQQQDDGHKASNQNRCVPLIWWVTG